MPPCHDPTNDYGLISNNVQISGRKKKKKKKTNKNTIAHANLSKIPNESNRLLLVQSDQTSPDAS